MSKKFPILFSLLFLFFGVQAHAYEDKIDIKVNGEYIYTASDTIIENGVSFAPIRFLSAALGAGNVNWNGEDKTVSIEYGTALILIDLDTDIAYIDGQPKNIRFGAKIINDRAYTPVRFTAELFGASVLWNDYYKNAEITKANHIVPKNLIDTSYNDDDLFWLGRIIHAESRGEPLKGKIAVGNVILNRVKSSSFPSTIYSVIFDKTYATQFEPVANGAIYNTPDPECIKAAKHSLDGTSVVGDSLYFFNPSKVGATWIAANREYYTTISNHDFYL